MLSSSDGTQPSSIRTHRATPPGPARQCKPFEPAGAQRHPVCRRTWLQMARVTGEIWQLAHHPHPDEPLVEERGAGPGVRTPATRADRAHQARGDVDGQHHRQGPSRRDGCAKKKGPQAIGRSRGGWTTKIHMVAADARTAITFSLSPGQAHDAPEGRKLLNRLGQQHDSPSLIMDRAYEGDETRQLALALGYEASGAAVANAGRTLGVRPRDVQAAQRNRAIVSSIEGIPPRNYSPTLSTARPARAI